MIPVPSEDDSILGRVLLEEPGAGTSFEAEARPNPCEDYLMPARKDDLKQEIHRAQALGGSVEARAALQGFGFSASSETDTHLVFEISTEKKVVVRDTNDYLACCREHDCGFGYISTLVYGSGEYASGTETRVEAEADYLRLAGAAGSVNVAASERKRVQGWVAAVVTPHEVLREMDDTRSKGFIAGGAATFALGVGALGLMGFGIRRGANLEKEREQNTVDRDASSAEINNANTIARAGAVVGSVLTVAGVALLVVGVRGRGKKRFALSPSPTGGGLAVRF